jgi:hypothetical protein
MYVNIPEFLCTNSGKLFRGPDDIIEIRKDLNHLSLDAKQGSLQHFNGSVMY